MKYSRYAAFHTLRRWWWVQVQKFSLVQIPEPGDGLRTVSCLCHMELLQQCTNSDITSDLGFYRPFGNPHCSTRKDNLIAVRCGTNSLKYKDFGL